MSDGITANVCAHEVAGLGRLENGAPPEIGAINKYRLFHDAIEFRKELIDKHFRSVEL